MAHLDEHKLLSDRQHAFPKRHSCETQLITVINDQAKILDKDGQVDTFILDFEKAFDIPPHELLKCKLYGYGIGGKTEQDRFFSLFQAAASCSKWNKIRPCFVRFPQGTILGPVLFSLYINDITRDTAVCWRLCILSRNQRYRGHCETSGGYRLSGSGQGNGAWDSNQSNAISCRLQENG